MNSFNLVAEYLTVGVRILIEVYRLSGNYSNRFTMTYIARTDAKVENISVVLL